MNDIRRRINALRCKFALELAIIPSSRQYSLPIDC